MQGRRGYAASDATKLMAEQSNLSWTGRQTQELLTAIAQILMTMSPTDISRINHSKPRVLEIIELASVHIVLVSIVQHAPVAISQRSWRLHLVALEQTAEAGAAKDAAIAKGGWQGL